MNDGFGRLGVSQVKGRGNVVTEVDLAVERACHELLKREYPDHAILSEETAPGTRSDGWMWVVDPLDGTKNFSRAIPHFCFTIALCHRMEPVLGLTLQPLLGEEYFAVAGEGASLTGVPMRVSSVGSLSEAVIGADIGYEESQGRRQIEMALAVYPGMESLRVSGSAALGLAYAAAGRFDIYVHSDLEPWDTAAGLLLVREAGGVVMDREGGQATLLNRGVLAGGAAVVADFQRVAGGLPWR